MIKATLLTSNYNLSKKLSLSDDGNITKKASAYLKEGTAEVKEFSDMRQFGEFLKQLTSKQSICFGTPNRTPTTIFSTNIYQQKGCPTDATTRTNENFRYPEGPGIFHIDYDPDKNSNTSLDQKELLDVFTNIIPNFDNCDYCWWTSAGSNIHRSDTGKQLTGVRGQRVYIGVKDADDIPRAGEVLFKRLWLNGHGHIEVSKAGSLLIRTLVDAAVWQPNRLDFAAGAICGKGLEQHRPDVLVHDGALLDTRKLLPDLSHDEEEQYQVILEIEKKKMQPQADVIKAKYMETKTLEIAGSNPTEERLAAARKVVHRAVNNCTLTRDWPIRLNGGRVLTVGELLDDPQQFDQQTCHDPLEPDYDGARVVAKIYLNNGKPNIHSQAHGGRTFSLIRQPHRIKLLPGRTAEGADEALRFCAQLPDVFIFAGQLVRVDSERVLPFDQYSLANYLGGVCQFYKDKMGSNGQWFTTDCDPPVQLVQQILSIAATRDLKQLTAVITAPTICPDGRLVERLGYDLDTHLLLNISDHAPPIPTKPTKEQVQTAVNELMHPVASFPFASDLDKSVCLAALLSAVVRPTIPTCPGFGIDASVQASGKTLLARFTAELSIGRPAPVFPHSDTRGRGADEEIKKTILAALLADYRTLIWDNVLGIFDNAAIASLLTSPVIEGRILGQTKMAKADNRLLFLMTGNNLHLTGDMPRRVLVCRLIPETDRPYARIFDLDPLEYVRNNRQRLVAAALTIIRGWFASTDYLVDKTAPGRMASFESWDDLVRQPVAWLSRTYSELGLVDVMEAVDATQAVDPELQSLGELWEQLYLKYGKSFFTAKDLFNLDFSDPQIHDLLCEVAGKELTSSQSIGLVLNYRRDRFAKGYRLKQYVNTKGHQYKVEKVKSN